MRKIYFAVLIAGILIALAAPVKAQIHFNLNVNLSSQPVWGPTGYDDVQYYYLPDIGVYYYVPGHRFYYQSRGRWVSSSNMPQKYRYYDLYRGYKVVINEHKPYLRDRDYREKYKSDRNRHDQQAIRDSRDSKYFVNKGHPEHNNWVKQQKHDNRSNNGKDNGYKKDNRKGEKQNGQNNKDRGRNHKK